MYRKIHMYICMHMYIYVYIFSHALKNVASRVAAPGVLRSCQGTHGRPGLSKSWQVSTAKGPGL